MRRRRERAGVVAVCLLLSTGVHVGALTGLGLWWAPKPSPEPTKKPKVTYLDLRSEDETEEDEDDKPEDDKPEPREPKPEQPRPKPKPEVELDELEEPEPEPEDDKPEPEPEPEPEEPKPPMEIVLEQLKSVEQPDELDEQETPEDVNYLSNINRDVERETRAEVTNLEKDAVTPEAAQVEPTEAQDSGTANEDVIAQDETVESQLNRQAPDTKPELEEERPEQDDPKPKSLLAMRELEHRDHVMAQDAHEALADEADQGTLQAEAEKQATIEKQNHQARIDKSDARYKFKLKEKDLVALFGKDLAAKKRAESKKESKKKGVWEERRAHFQSPLENMVPEVQPGNQTALRSRKHPFARYIAQMHRKIHEAWAWGFLEQLDTRGRNHPLNNHDLWTRVEIVLAGDGSIDKVVTIRHSGSSSFDAAAREIVWSSGPYPNPPREIMSGNGKIYMHWAFHRDNRACGTFGAQPFILDNAGQGDRPDPNIQVRAGRGSERLERRLNAKPKAPAVAEGPAPPPGHSPAEHAHNHDHDHSHDGHDHGDGKAHPAGTEGRAKLPVALPKPSADELASDPGAKKVANEWLYHFGKGNVGKVSSRSSLPFHSGEAVMARTREELHDSLAGMIAEAKGSKPKGLKVYTAARLRRVFGSVPSGVQEGGDRVYGLTKIGAEYVILMLEQRFGSWRVVGFTR